MELTREQAIEEHRKMWNWIADETEKRKMVITKEDYIRSEINLEYISNNCFCCEYGENSSNNKCDVCPIVWDSKYNNSCNNSCIYNKNSPYLKWVHIILQKPHSVNFHLKYYKEAAKLAREIANLPERDINK